MLCLKRWRMREPGDGWHRPPSRGIQGCAQRRRMARQPVGRRFNERECRRDVSPCGVPPLAMIRPGGGSLGKGVRGKTKAGEPYLPGSRRALLHPPLGAWGCAAGSKGTECWRDLCRVSVKAQGMTARSEPQDGGWRTSRCEALARMYASRSQP
ncbi:MAG: hypothetical protein EOL87_17020 [Spartobacteria bacterium]|nr:hypothetical protein [Spartobacteria bacterium]